MDLISRKAAIEAVKIPNGEYPNPSERHGIIIARVEARRRIGEIPSVPAVPLDKLCELLCGMDNKPYCDDCRRLGIECDYRKCGSPGHWKEFLTKWMEEQDVAD